MIRKSRTVSVFVLIMLALPMIADAANDSFVPSFKDGMKDTPASVKTTMQRVINWGEVALVAVAIVYTLYHGISAVISGKRGDAAGRSDHLTDVFRGVFILLVVSVVITLINYITA